MSNKGESNRNLIPADAIKPARLELDEVRHKLQRISIAELIAYRQARDKLIERAGEFPVESEIGTLTGYAFLTPFDPVYHMAFVHGRIGDGNNVLTRLHRANIISDVFGGAKPIHRTLARFKTEGRGVLVLLRDGTAGVPVVSIPKSGDTASEEARTRQWREVGVAPRTQDETLRLVSAGTG